MTLHRGIDIRHRLPVAVPSTDDVSVSGHLTLIGRVDGKGVKGASKYTCL